MIAGLNILGLPDLLADSLVDEVIVDSFAGGGGTSTGIEMALGRSPDYAINHDREALALHRANHPGTIHLSQNIYKVDPITVVGRRKVGLFWASPDCKHFSKAKGGTPVSREIRDLAWIVVQWAQRVRPRVIILENVEEFQTWGPLIETRKGKFKPDPERRGETFNQWVSALRAEGYVVEWRELRACDFGAPTTRKRLFVIARCDGRAIVWPKPTHAPLNVSEDGVVTAWARGHGLTLADLQGLKPYRTAASDVIDWSIPCPSIFDTSEEIMAKFGVRAVRPLAEATMTRIAKGVKRYVLNAARPFIIRTDMASAAKRNGVHGLDEPTRTQTTSGGFAIVSPLLAGVGGRAGQSRPRSAGEPTATSTTKADTVLVAPVLTSAQHGGSHRSAEEPHRTIAASDKDQNQVVAAHLMTMRNAQKPFNEVDKPTHTVTAGGAGLSLVAASMVQTGYGERKPRYRCLACEDEFTDAHAGGVGGLSPAECPRCGEEDRIELVDSGQEPRALDPGAPLGTVVAGGVKHGAVAAFLAQHNTGLVGHDARKPVSTLTTGGEYGAPQQAVVSAHLLTNTTGHPGADAAEPVPTVATGGHHAVVSGGLMNMKGEDRATWSIDGGTPTQTAGGQHVAEVRAFLMKYYGVDQDPRIEEPLSTVTTKDRFGIVMVDGQPYRIADIGMRMLTPRELFRAQGFPADYEIETGVFENGERRALSKTAQVRMCGNSVCPPMAAALVAANCSDLAIIREAAE